MREREKRISLDSSRPSKGTFPGGTWEDGNGTIVREEGGEREQKDRREGTEKQITELADTLIY